MPQALYLPSSLKTHLSFWLWVLERENFLTFQTAAFSLFAELFNHPYSTVTHSWFRACLSYSHKPAISAASPGIPPKVRIKQATLSIRTCKVQAGREEVDSNRSVFYCTWHLPSASCLWGDHQKINRYVCIRHLFPNANELFKYLKSAWLKNYRHKQYI